MLLISDASAGPRLQHTLLEDDLKGSRQGLVIPSDQFASFLGLLRAAQISSDRRENRKLWSQGLQTENWG